MNLDAAGWISGALPWAQLPAFALAVLVLNATPGADLLLTIGRTLQAGARAGVATALGISAGCIVHTLAAALGLAALLAVSQTAFTLLKIGGAAYLLWLALGLARSAIRRAPAAAAGAASPEDRPQMGPNLTPKAGVGPDLLREFRTGFITNALNPKVALFFLAFLPQFIAPDAPHKAASFLLLGGWMLLQSALFLLATVALLARLRRHLRLPDSLRRGLEALAAGLFGWFAWRLASARL